MYNYFKKINVSIILSLLLILILPFTNVYGESAIFKEDENSSTKLKLSIDNLLNSNYLSTVRDVSFNYSVTYYNDGENGSGSKLILTSGEIISKDNLYSEKIIVENNKIQDGFTTNYRLYKDTSNNMKVKFMEKESSWEDYKLHHNSKIDPMYIDYQGYYDNSNVDVIKDIKLHFDMIKSGTMTAYKDNQNNTHAIGEINTNGIKDTLHNNYALFGGCQIKYEYIISNEGKLIEYISNRHIGNTIDSMGGEDGNFTVKVLFNYDKVDLSNTSNLDNLFDTSSFSKWKGIIAKEGFQGLEATYNIYPQVQSPNWATITSSTIKKY